MAAVKRRACSAAALALALLCVPQEVAARFMHEDASEIDREERLSSETYNDEVSYRFPLRWGELWDLSTIGYRVNAGSYNITRFMFLEDVKVTTDAARPVSFGFKQKRDEDMVEQRLASEIRLSFNRELWRVALVGDGSTFKQYGDVGLSLMAVPTQMFSAEAVYWSVDHYYNSKKEFVVDSYTKRPKTYSLRLKWEFPGTARLRYDLDYDAHTKWTRLSQDYYYEYSRMTHHLALRIGDRRGYSFNIDAYIDAKSEDKEHVTTVGNYHKSLDRSVSELEASVVYSPQVGTDAAAGIIHVARDAQYNYAQDAAVTPDLVNEPYSPSATRDEMVYYSTYYHPVGGASYFQYGLFVNDVERTEVGAAAARNTEVKFQFAWDFQIDKYASVFLNTTWDLDHLYENFPYRTAAFKPWGGGNLQFIAVF